MSLVTGITAAFQRVAEEFNSTFTGETYTGNLDSAPFGYKSFVGADVTNEPAGFTNGLVFTAKNEDDSGRVQLAYSTSGDYAIRWRLGGAWGSWSPYTAFATEGFQWWQTFTLHAVGVGQQDMGIWIPYNCTITKIRHRCGTAGTGGSPLVQLQTSPLAGTGVISGTSFAPATSPSWNNVSINLNADDMLWSYMTAINTTTVGAQIKTEMLVVRR